MKRGRIVVAVLGVALIAAVWSVAVGDTDQGVPEARFLVEDRDTLRGLDGVFVLVEEIEPEIERYGLTKQALQTDTELQLRQYGIKVLSRVERLAAPGSPYLYVNVGVKIGNEVPLCGVAILTQLKQTVRLKRDLTMQCWASTWNEAYVSLVGRENLGQIRDRVRDQIAMFINDYLAVNPREPQSQTANDEDSQ